MKKNFNLLTLALLLVAALVTGCKKPKPGEGEEGLKTLSFSIPGLPNTSSTRNDLYAVYTITNDKDVVVVADRRSDLNYTGSYRTADLALPAGKYKLTKFLVFDSRNIISYAIPKKNSQKASLVQNALNIDVIVTNDKVQVVDVAQVNPLETPQLFGYADDVFSAPPDPADFIKIKVHPVIRIGDVMYDSIPVTFLLSTWDAGNNETVENTVLPAGVSEVTLRKAATKYKLKTIKWGITDELVLQPSDINSTTTYSLGGYRASKLIKSSIEYKLTNGSYVPFAIHDYLYSNQNKIQRIVHKKKDAAGNWGIGEQEIFSYDNYNRIIENYKEDGSKLMVSDDHFYYQQDGKLAKLLRFLPQEEVTAVVSYQALPGQTGSTRNYRATVSESSTVQYYSTTYNLDFVGGNLLQEQVATSHGNLKHGLHQFDAGINPLVHLQIPDITFAYSSRNNRRASAWEFQNAYPEMIAYEEIFTYDTEGYPKELIRRFKSYISGQFVQETKTTFTY